MTDARTGVPHCTLTPDCGFPPHEAAAHPCGQPVCVGDPCAYCGDPIGADDSGTPNPCPRCWRPITIADVEALAAGGGWETAVTPRPRPEEGPQP